MPSSEALTDDYVAQLLAKDAKDRTINHSSYGLQAILPKRPTTNAPKPNTRFLKNIIRETDNHNAALRAKEIADARLRLRGINGDESRDGQKNRRGDGRWDGDRPSSKRRRLDAAEDKQRAHREDKSSRRSHRHGDRDDNRYDRRRRSRYEDYSNDSDVERSHRHHRRRQSRSTSSDSNRGRRRRSRHRHRSSPRSSSRSLSRSRSPRRKKHTHRHHRSHHRKRHPSPSSSASPPIRSPTNTTSHKPSPISPRPPSTYFSASDSDPLTNLIGPLPPSKTSPPPLRRGRGTHTLNSSSAIDTHFKPTYNPTLDIQPTALEPAEEDDWDNALEALRDRAKWRQSGAERLRAAGFTDEEVRKWEKGGTEGGGGGEENVRWRGRGEGREWDRGKVVEDDGVQVEAEWGRLKGT
ncbi:MAG: hypothetical protein Q9166_002055 [cf. Caloplaca sp. 2 TL-2023]